MVSLFPYDSLRPEQESLLRKVHETIQQQGTTVIHAPTGLGKTAAALTPALEKVATSDTFILFLTSRHTQHQIVHETLKKINIKHHKKFVATSIIGKKWMCLQEGAETMMSSDFSTFCKQLREDNKCTYYINTRGKKAGVSAELALHDLQTKGMIASEDIITTSKHYSLCPYETGLLLAENAHVIIADYFYIFNPSIRDRFLAKINRKLEHAIVIVDEGHNLPGRLRDVLTQKLNTSIIKGAITEAKKFELEDVQQPLEQLLHSLEKLGQGTAEEKTITKEALVSAVQHSKDYDELVQEFIFSGELVLSQQKQSRLSWIAMFLEAWKRETKGFARILSKKGTFIGLTLRALDPALISKDVSLKAYSTILMSGTLTPPAMYKEILGFDNATTYTFKSPFSEHNMLPIIIPKTTTKYAQRSELQYKNIAALCAQVANTIPGNVLLFFPSYSLRNSVYQYFVDWYDNTIFLEQPHMTKLEKKELLNKYTRYKNTGSSLLAVSAGSFGEGVDLPGIIKGVIVIGLPLDRPDLETQELIRYYDELLGKGWDYGYIMPAMNKTFQNAGRCIRSETDYGTLVFIDERYQWNQYKKCFPSDWNLKISHNALEDIEEFFSTKEKTLPLTHKA